MRALLSLTLFWFATNLLLAQGPVEISTVFSSEKQNLMASEIPGLLLEAYRNGDIAAYYPQNMNVRIPYVQFLQHYGESEKAAQILSAPPAWFCDGTRYPKLEPGKQQCFKERFEIGEQVVRNDVTMMPEKKQAFIRLIFSAECHDIGATLGPVFKIDEMERLGSAYRITNPQNSAVKYRLYELIKLRLYHASQEIRD
jgi:hypothetical protein